MTSLVFANGELDRIRARLLEDAPDEAAAVLIASPVATPDGYRLLVRETHFVPAEDYIVRSPERLAISPSFVARMIKRAKLANSCVVFVHSHPFAERAWFSQADDDGEEVMSPTLHQRIPGQPHCWVVVAPSDQRARLHLPNGSVATVDDIVDVGPRTRRYVADSEAEEVHPHAERTVRAIGAPGQRLLGRLRVGIVGLGGIGSLVAQQLAYLGVRHVVLMDPDHVEPTNLNRLVTAMPSDVGASKVSVAERMYQGVAGGTANVVALQESALFGRHGAVLTTLDAVFCCTDSHGSRAILNQLAYQYYVPVFDSGLVIEAPSGSVSTITGRVQMIAPGLPCLICQELLDPGEVRRDLMIEDERRRDPYIVGTPEPQPAVVSLNSTIASLSVTMFLAAMVGLPSDARFQLYNGTRGVVRLAQALSHPQCFVCSDHGSLGRGLGWTMPWRLD